MDRNSQEKKERNRELVGEGFEIIGNQALCTCTNGSKPASLSVVSQQKYYCNGAAKLMATNGDKDTRSLNFGNCKARNNSPCMAVIQWNQFYDKILIGKSLCPLTMKSEGTCVCGGKITFKTSGQQVMITPPLSMREAGQVVYSNPLFKKEDIKTVQKKEQKKSDTPLTQYSKNAFVNSVRVNGTVNVSLKVHGNEKLLFVHTLTRDADPSTPVKWDVTHNGKDISVGLLEPPLRSFFTEEGEYKVFAYVHNRGSKKGGGYVTLTVSEPKFVSLEWKDANEKKTHYMGRRHVVYAHTKFEGTGDIPVEARFYYKSLNGKQYLTNFAPLRIEQDGMAKIELSLTSSQVEEIKKVPIEKTPIYMELFSKEWVKDLKLSKKTPIEYTDKEDITSIAFYRDKDCKEAIKGFVESGQTIYARVTTRGLDDSDIALFIYKHGTVTEEETSTKGGVYKVSGETDAKGITVLKIKTDTSWLKEKQSETFDIFVLEGGAKETAVIMPNGRGYTERNTTKFFQMGKDKGILLLSMPRQDVEVGQSKTMVQEVNNNDCGGKYCITQHNYKQYNCSKLIQEINIRLAGFGGNVPTGEFTQRTKNSIMQFQRDYMGVPPTGKICGSLLKAIDRFAAEYIFNFEETKCKCKICSGYGDGKNKGLYLGKKVEAYHRYEYPGIHRSLLWALKTVLFYLKKDGRFTLNKINSGYRCRHHPEYLKKPTTNHMGKALDLHFNKNGQRTRNIKDMETIRQCIFNKYLGAKWDWKLGQINIFNLESTKIGAKTWVHYDVREFETKYLADEFFTKNFSKNEKSMIAIAKEIGLKDMCNCLGIYIRDTKGTKDKEERIDPNKLKTSSLGISFITSFESCKLLPYNDSENHATIGYGHLISSRSVEELVKNNSMPKKYRNGITKQEANDLFISDLNVTEEGLRKRVKVPLFQCEFDALVSLLYNAGVDLKAPKLFTHLENKEYQAAAEEFKDIINRGTASEKGLRNRRLKEVDIFNNSNYINN